MTKVLSPTEYETIVRDMPDPALIENPVTGSLWTYDDFLIFRALNAKMCFPSWCRYVKHLNT